ncbi:MAG: ABC transporter permease [Spirochaetota bacterium]
MRVRWILFVAARYFRTKRKDKGLAPSLLSVAGIIIGVMTLISVLSVMNGFQLGFVEDIVEISSYHIRIENTHLSQADIDSVRAIPGIKAVIPFSDIQTMIMGAFSGFQGCLLRCLPPEADSLDSTFSAQLNLVEGSFDLSTPNSMVMGFELAQSLGVGIGDMVATVSLVGGSFSSLKPADLGFIVTGIFKSGYYEFDRSLNFVSLETAAALLGEKAKLTYGIKLVDRFKDQVMVEAIRKKLNASENVISWREFNSSFFGALRMEKLVMMVLIGLIFVVVGVNIYHSLRRAVYERIEEIAVMKSVGASPVSIQSVFILDGIFIGSLGALVGLILGLEVSANINHVFAVAEAIVNGIRNLLQSLLLPFFDDMGDRFSLFSSSYYYLTEVPVRILFPEIVLVFLFAVISSVSAAFFASMTVSEVKPSEVLRYE